MDSLKENHRQFIRNYTSTLKKEQRFKSKIHNALLKKLIRLR